MTALLDHPRHARRILTPAHPAPEPDLGPAPLQLHQVVLSYPDGQDSEGRARTVTALDHVDFQARAGRLTALVGASGSGKSSLLAVAAGLVRPDAGQVLVAGQDLAQASEKERARARREQIGVVFQQPNLLASLTAREQLLLGDHVRGLRGRRLRERTGRADELLARVGLEEAAHRRVHQLSGGQRQRVNIARALMGTPAVLLADEPTSALDQARSQEIVDLLLEVTRELGVATVMVTHAGALLDSVDEVVTMADGRLLA